MFVIIEGMDRCGKTTLIKNLRKSYFKNPRTIVHHSSSPPKVDDPSKWEEEHYRHLFHTFAYMSNCNDYDIILDRFHLGSVVYGKKYRNIDEDAIFTIDKHYHTYYPNMYLIVLVDEPSEIIKRDDGDSLETSIDDYEYTKTEFEKCFEKSHCRNKLLINVSRNGGFQNTLPTVTDFLEGMKE